MAIVSSGTVNVGNGESVNGNVLSGSYVKMIVSDGGKAYQTEVKSGAVTVKTGGYAENTSLSGSQSEIVVSKNGSANGVTGKNQAVITMIEGAKVTNLDLDGKCEFYIAVTSDTILTGTSNGKDVLVSNGVISNITLSGTGVRGYGMEVEDGWTAYDTKVMHHYSTQTINDGGKAYRTEVEYNGTVIVNAGGYAEDTVVNGANGTNTSMVVKMNGSAENIEVKNNGILYVSSGAEVTNVNIDNSGILYVDAMSDTVLTGTSNGKSIKIGDGIMSNITLSGTGVRGYGMEVEDGWTAYDTKVMHHYSTQTINDGGKAYRTEVEYNGTVIVNAGGYAEDTVVNGANGTRTSMVVNVNGVADGVTVKNDATLFIKSGGTLTGSATFDMGSATVSAGGIVDFSVGTQKASDGYLINDLSKITGAPTYTMTVSENQASGTYKLAQGADNFDQTITVKVNNSELGTLTVGSSLQNGTATYSLNLTDDSLTLTVTGGSTPAPEECTVTHAVGIFNGAGGVFDLSQDGKGVVRTASGKTTVNGTIDTDEWQLLGAGDFNKNGNDGLLWIEKDTGYVYMQNDLTSFNEVANKTNCLGVVGEGYEIRGVGDFTGTGIDGVVMKGPAFGDASISLNYGLPIWGREADGTTFNGWLGALVNTWQPGEALEGNTSNLADINAKNYMYEIVDVGDYNGDGVDDVMLQNIMPKTVDGVTITGSGDVFTFLTGDIDAVKAGASPTVVYAGCATDGWEVLGSGDFNGDGIDDTLLSDGTGVAGWAMSNGQRYENQWFGNLSCGEEIVGISDVNNDGTDDILVHNASTDQMTAWLVKDGAATGTLAIA